MSEEKQFPPQTQDKQPGEEKQMHPKPLYDRDYYKGADKLKDKVALITGGDSGIGRAVAIAYAKEGADVAIVYLNEDEDAIETKEQVEKHGRRCLLLPGDIANEDFCFDAVTKTINEFGQLDILVNNAAEQWERKDFESMKRKDYLRVFETNIFAMFAFTQAALGHMKKGSSIINTTSVTAYEGHKTLIDYSCTKGAIVTFTRSMALHLAESGIRVNGVAPGPIWTPLIPSSFDEEHVASFGADTALGRAGQPAEVAPSYVFLASEDASYITGQILHPNGGRIVNG